MNHFVISSNPADVYRAKDWLDDGNIQVDWISAAKNPLEVGDVVYIYEVVPRRGGRGGIVYMTKVIQTNLSLKDKFDDREYWVGRDYPIYIKENTIFNRLELISTPNNGVLPLAALQKFGFHPPINGAQSLDMNQNLLHYVEEHFG
jgi:hypothetical protein